MEFHSCLVGHPEDAVSAGADAVITFLVLIYGYRYFHREMASAIAAEIEPYMREATYVKRIRRA